MRNPLVEPANRFELTATLLERKSVRYSPAGIAFLDCLLGHGSMQHEAGQERQVNLELAALGADNLARRLDSVALGSVLKASGFLAQRSLRGKTLVFHITEFELLEKD